MRAFDQAGFDVVRRIELRTTGWKQLGYKLLLMLPFSLRRAFGIYPSRVAPAASELIWLIAQLINFSLGTTYLRAAKEHTLFIAKKRAQA